MAFATSRTSFVHVPRTGGWWLTEVVSQIAKTFMVYRDDVLGHASLAYLPKEWSDRQSFVLLRHPYSWVKSRWAHSLKTNARQEKRFPGIHQAFDELVVDSFEQTLRNLLSQRPGLVGDTFGEMTSGVDVVGQTEHLPYCAIEFFGNHEIAVQHNLRLFYETPKLNTGTGALVPCEPELITDFLYSEERALELWSNGNNSRT